MASRESLLRAKQHGPNTAGSLSLAAPTLARPKREPLLQPKELDPLKNLLLFAESIVEGFFAGKHRSMDYGSNAEFAEHKAYTPGDPVGHVDWKVYARSKRLVVRKFRDEKDLTGYIVLDISRSMAYRGAGEDKLLRAARIAACLAYLMQRQGDKSGLALFNARLVSAIPSGGTRRHLYDVVSTLEASLQRPRGETAAHQALSECASLFRRRGSLIIISDFLTDLDAFFESLSLFVHRRFQVLLLHVMDPHEYELPQIPMAQFVDLESHQKIQVAPEEIRTAYRKQTDSVIARIQNECLRTGVAYQLLRTERPYREALEAWLGVRGKSKSHR